MELMLASEARDKACHAEFDIVARDTEELMNEIIEDIEKSVSEGKFLTLIYTREYHQDAVKRACVLLSEKGYFSEQFNGVRLEISWDTKNPFRRRYEVQ